MIYLLAILKAVGICAGAIVGYILVAIFVGKCMKVGGK